MAQQLTKTQKQIVEFVRGYDEENGVPPTYTEIATGIDVAVRAVQYQLDKLEGLGVVSRARRNGRCIPRTIAVLI